VGECLDLLGRRRAAAESNPDLGVGGSSRAPAEDSPLDGAQDVLVGDGSAPGQSSEARDAGDVIFAAAEAVSDLGHVDAVIEEAENSTFHGAER